MPKTFKADSQADWQARILKELKGRPFEDLITHTKDGIALHPFYTKAANLSVLASGSDEPWRIRQEFFTDNSANNVLIHEALMAGVDSISVDAERLDEDLAAVNVEMIEVEIAGEDFHPRWMEYLDGQGIDTDDVKGGYAWDPYGGMLMTGDFEAFEIMPTVLQMMSMESIELPDWYFVNVGGDNYHNAGATAVQELAFSLSQLNFYLMYEPSLASHMAMSLAAGTDYFETACKLRTMRILWANLMRDHKQPEAQLRLFARSATKDLAPVDAHSNLLRATAQCMAAVAGGADRVIVLPFDAEGDAFSYRMARNIQQLLIHESYMDKALNPMQGAYLFEELTAQMATAAWQKFKEIESFGGWGKYCFRGRLQDEVKESADKWAAQINTGEQTWLGVNKYPAEGQKEWRGIEVLSEQTEFGLELPQFKNKLG